MVISNRIVTVLNESYRTLEVAEFSLSNWNYSVYCNLSLLYFKLFPCKVLQLKA